MSKRSKYKTTIYIENDQALILEHLKDKFNINVSHLIRTAIQAELEKWGAKITFTIEAKQPSFDTRVIEAII